VLLTGETVVLSFVVLACQLLEPLIQLVLLKRNLNIIIYIRAERYNGVFVVRWLKVGCH